MKGITQEMFNSIVGEYGLSTAMVAKLLIQFRGLGGVCVLVSVPDQKDKVAKEVLSFALSMAKDLHTCGAITDKGLDDLPQILARLEYAIKLESSDG